MGERGAVVSEQQLSNEFIKGLPKVDPTVVCSETDVDAIWQVLFSLASKVLKKTKNTV